jgi:phosphoribosylformimino-5-aminoimidazole carboxamide ribotide isomerase
VLIIPAVDIRKGRAVRLVQGRADREIVYDQDPVRAAQRWAAAGARRIHVVDLDGAFEGRPRNSPVVRKIIRALPDVEVEVGGGLRTARAAADMLRAGAARCVLGTKAAEDRAFLASAAHRHPGRISLGLDAKNGMVATKGWIEVRDLRAVDLLRSLAGLPLAEVIYTDVERDGMLEGPDFARLEELVPLSPFPVIASGGVSSLEDIRRIKSLGCCGCIIGKALFDGRLDLKEALNEGQSTKAKGQSTKYEVRRTKAEG